MVKQGRLMKPGPIYSRRNLPHIYPIGATFFITFRLNDSIPQHLLNEIRVKTRDELQTSLNEKNSLSEKLKILHKRFEDFEDHLDLFSYGQCHLKKLEVANILSKKILSFNGLYYTLLAYSIMPNHVHMIVDTSIQLNKDWNYENEEIPKDYIQVNSWMQLIKGGSSFLINKNLNRSGKLWASESYDHFIRNEKELEIKYRYTLENPTRASLPNEYSQMPYLYNYIEHSNINCKV